MEIPFWCARILCSTLLLKFLSSIFVGFQLLAYIYRVENSVDLDQQADFDSSRIFTNDIINDSLLKTLYCQMNYHILVSI